MTFQQQLVSEIEAFLRTCDMAESTFGRLAVNDGKFVGRMREGRGVQVDTVARVRSFIASFQRQEQRMGSACVTDRRTG